MSELEAVTMIVCLLLGPGSMAVLFITAVLTNANNFKRTWSQRRKGKQ